MQICVWVGVCVRRLWDVCERRLWDVCERRLWDVCERRLWERGFLERSRLDRLALWVSLTCFAPISHWRGQFGD